VRHPFSGSLAAGHEREILPRGKQNISALKSDWMAEGGRA